MVSTRCNILESSSISVIVNNGEYSINGGAFSSADGVVAKGQTLRLRQTSSSSFFTTTATNVTIGGLTAVFSVVTSAPDYIPDQITSDGSNTIFLLSQVNGVVFRWSMTELQYLEPLSVGIQLDTSTITPSKIAYSAAHERLYLGYSSGEIRYIDLNGNGEEIPFANTAEVVGGLAAVGNYVLAQDSSGAWDTHYVFDVDGNLTESKDWNYYSREYAWSDTNSRVYFSAMAQALMICTMKSLIKQPA